MPNTSPSQRKTEGRVMHEFKHGELKSGPGGKGGKVKSRRQAIAIALKEAGAYYVRGGSFEMAKPGSEASRPLPARLAPRVHGALLRHAAPWIR
jgi:Family of unknown function (DUF6496)